jgi:AMP nucleosidase
VHKFVSEKIVARNLDYRTGVIYTTNRRLWEHDTEFLTRLQRMTCIGIDMETATVFIVGHHNEIARGALLLVSDTPFSPEGVKTEESDRVVTRDWSDIHLDIGIEAMTQIGTSGEKIKHFRY